MWHNRINAITIIIPDIAVSEKKRYYFQSVSKLCNWVSCTIWLRKFEVGCNLKFFGADFLVTNKLYNHRTVKRPRGDCKTCDPITIYTNAWKMFGWFLSEGFNMPKDLNTYLLRKSCGSITKRGLSNPTICQEMPVFLSMAAWHWFPEIRQETILKTKVFRITEISDIPSLYSSIFALFGRGFRPIGQLARTIGQR